MTNPIDAIVGGNLRDRRLLAGLSQEELGAKVGLTFQQIQKYERGINRISASRLVELAGAVRCDLLDLFADVAQTSREIERRSAEELKAEHRAVRAYSALPRDVQAALVNLMNALTISVGAKLNVRDKL